MSPILQQTDTDIGIMETPQHPQVACSESELDYDSSSQSIAMSQDETEETMNGDNCSESLSEVIRIEWTGTSQFLLQDVIDLQAEGLLDQLITYRKALTHDITLAPCDPSFYLDLAKLDCKLGFTDIGVANAHKALILTEAVLDTSTTAIYPELKTKVSLAIATRLRTISAIIIEEELGSLQVDAYRWLLNGLLGCAASWDSLVLAKKALEKYPKDVELLDLRQTAKASFEDKHTGLIAVGTKPADLIALTGTGRIFQRQYPWLDESLHVRTPALLREINKHFGTRNCEVHPVVFGQSSSDSQSLKEVGENGDIGPLGVFASKDIEPDEIIMVDHSALGISDVPSSKLQHCDTCHAALIPPYFVHLNIIHPKCCSSIAFCSQSCHDAAVEGYHSIICGMDFDWLYSIPGMKGTYGVGTKWIPIMFLRIVATILADFSKLDSSTLPTPHPLQHPLIARMAANYSPSNTLPKVGHTWQYNENIICPASILLQLNINIFTDPHWTPEVIQTIIWRIENNANMCSTSLWDPSKAKVNMVSINPNYLFLNHSCNPNVSWHGTVEKPDMAVSWLEIGEGKFLKPGQSTVVCKAARKVRKGEELLISYVGDPLGMGEGKQEGMNAEGRERKRFWLNKWFEGGCGCEVCRVEDEADREQ